MANENCRITVTEAELDEIRGRLMDYYGTASFVASPFAQVDLVRVEGMSPQELVDEALRLGILYIR